MADDGWEPVTDPLEMRKVLGTQGMRGQMGGGGAGPNGFGSGRLSVQDQKFLNELRPQSQSGLDSLNQISQAEGAVNRLHTGPVRARLLEARIPQEKGGIFDSLGALLGNWTVPQQDQDDFQRLQGLASEQVMDAQIAQKGPQTEADAARLQMTKISPYKGVAVNKAVMRNGAISAALAAAKTPFYTKWAAANGGVNGIDQGGRSADDVWGQIVQNARARSDARSRGTPTPVRGQPQQQKPRAPSLPKGVTVERVDD